MLVTAQPEIETVRPSTHVEVQRYQFRVPLGTAPVLDADTVHVWLGEQDKFGKTAEGFAALLSEDELSRMLRFRFETDRSSFAFARGMLRQLLGMYLDAKPQDLRFAYSEGGKPRLSGEWGDSGLKFNLSHTKGAVLIGVSRDGEIGVDIEAIREDVEVNDISKRFFSAAEQKELNAFPDCEKRRDAFFHCWTRKEAFLKAKGHGLAHPLDMFDVSLQPTEARVNLVTRPCSEEACEWQIVGIPVTEHYAAAVAVKMSETE